MKEEMQFEVDDVERRHLQEMMRHPGYRVMRKILTAYIDQYQDAAVARSQNDPLKHTAEVAHAWAYVSIAREIVQRLDTGITFELSLLTPAVRKAITPAAIDLRRRHFALGELDPPPEPQGDAQ